MAYPVPLDPESITEENVAYHKGFDVPTVRLMRSRGQRRIESIIRLQGFLDWYDTHKELEKPWRGNSTEAMKKAVNSWCERHWPYNVKELCWTFDKVAATLHAPTLDAYNAETGKKIDWSLVVELSPEHRTQLVQIFNL